VKHSYDISALLASRYVVERELGHGGMSSVYLAHDIKHGRKVALKVVRPDLGAAIGPDRFAREIRLTAQLTHPHILPLLDSDQVNGLAYYVMPFVEGESLRDRITRERRMSEADALQVAREVADALAYAHSRNVVHRDIKPENILFSAGHAVVADFGIARAMTVAASVGEHSVTRPGIAIGTPTYMSPEQSLGEEVDGRSDVYSLGCVLYEMLTGAVPFQANTLVAMLARKVTGVVPEIRLVRSDISAEVEAIVQKSLAREAASRFARAADLVEAIDAARGVTGAPVRVDVAHNAVAVLAFVNMGPEASDDYLGDGISEELMHALTRLGGLKVIARTSAFSFKGSSLDVREIGQRLKVRRVVEGSVRRSGERLRVTAKLIDADNAVEIWSERFDRRLDDVFAIEDEISAAIATRLKSLLLEESGQRIPTRVPGAAPTASFTAYEQYLKGRYCWALRTEAGMRRSIDHLERALTADPKFALAHAALAETLATMGLYGMAPPSDVMPLAVEAAEQALALDGLSSEAFTARACVRAVFDWDWGVAAADFERAMAANPQYPTAPQWYASNVLVPQGRFAEAHQALARARELDPLSLSIATSVAAALYYERRYSEAVTCSQEVLQMDDRFPMGHYFLGLSLEQAGRLDDAVAVLERGVSLSDSSEMLSALGLVQATSRDLEAARATMRRLELRSAERYDSPVLQAQLALRLGDADRAMLHLLDAQSRRSADLIWIGVRPAFDPLRSEPEFQRLLGAVRLAAPALTRPDTTRAGIVPPAPGGPA